MKKHSVTFQPVPVNVNFPEIERTLLAEWYEKGIVAKYLHRNENSSKRFSFYDGPITANNPMGVHHAWGRSYKDLWQRFYVLRGYKERFQNGFDCQGLWVEVEVEKELGIKNKHDIENLIPGDREASVAKFVELCKERVRKFSAIQTDQSKRLGYIVDWDNSYYTMSDANNYMIWHFLKTCDEKGWIYKGKDSVPWCPRCQTAISQHEMLTEDYKELTHETVFLKLPIQTKGWSDTFLLVWTTTPWTIPANVAVGVNTKFTYAIWASESKKANIVILDTDENGNVPTRMLKGGSVPINEYIFGKNSEFKKVKTISGKELVGLTYMAPFDRFARVTEAQKSHPTTFHTVVDGSMIVVSTEGTGLLHVAPGAGKEDFDLGKKEHLPVISVIDDEANYLDQMDEFSGKNAKKHPELIIDYLKTYENGSFLHKTMQFTHRYPACWRCKTELVWKVTNEWYIAMDIPEKGSSAQGSTLREQMKQTARMIDWRPAFGLDRELDWLDNMHDWLISKKNRYWGLALPIYECEKCGSFTVIGSKQELKSKAVSGWNEFEGHSPHKPFIDSVKISCKSCKSPIQRLDDVGNVWLDAGIIGFSTLIDPKTGAVSYTSDKAYWKEWFPADFITESFPGQFKNWFYSMIAMSTVLEKRTCFKTVLGYASVLGEDGRPMHKSWGNAIEFNEGADKIGADVMRWMFVKQNPEQNILFGYRAADETRRKFHLLLWNVYNFFVTYALIDGFHPDTKKTAPSDNILDQWILSRLATVTKTVTDSLVDYDPMTAALSIERFVTDLSQWYVRRSRDRIGPSAPKNADATSCYTTLHTVLTQLCILLAPFNPFLSDYMYTHLTSEESVHLTNWPEIQKKHILPELENDMGRIRDFVEKLHAKRKSVGIGVRQVLRSATLQVSSELDETLISLLKAEVNVKNVIQNKAETDGDISLDTTLTPELIAEGKAREIVRTIQILRKEKGCKIDELVSAELPEDLNGLPDELLTYIRKEALLTTIVWAKEFKVLTG